MEKVCKNCKNQFTPLPNIKKQCYCSKKACQKARKKKWHQEKLKSDQAYRQNQADTQAAWHEKHPNYWKEYRERNPQYTTQNRLKQQERNKKQRKTTDPVIAKMDESNSRKELENKPISGTYLLTPLDEQGIAKMDAWKVEINGIASVFLDSIRC